MPAITVVICTRNRGAGVVRCLHSLLGGSDSDFEVLVIDQSNDDSTGAAIHAALSDPRILYRKSASRGLAAARNVGVALSQAALVAMTDDDCEVDVGWVAEVRRALENPQVDMVFGGVRSAPHDTTLGFIPSCSVPAEFLATRAVDKVRLDGMGACMAFRRETWAFLGGFDEMLGAGAPFLSGEETDFCLRALLAGRGAYMTPRIAVVHHGFRARQDARALAHGYWYGTGASVFKLIRCGHIELIGLLARLGWRFFLEPSPIALSLMGQASRWSRLRAFGSGAWAAARLPIVANRGVFQAG